MRLYSFFNSSAAYRVRIALALKNVAFDTFPINIRTGGQRSSEYLGPVNCSPAVPVLEEGNLRVSQSLSIIDYLDGKYPTPRLIPTQSAQRARVLSLANLISCDIHPLNNLKVLRFLQDTLNLSADQKDQWYRHWVSEGFTALERMLKGDGPYCFGETVSLADCCLIPQVANVRRMNISLADYPRISAIFEFALRQPAFQAAAPERQPDYTT